MAQTLDAWQTTFFLSVLSNAVSSTVVTAESATDAEQALSAGLNGVITTAFADPSVQQLIGTGWKLVWGPAVTVLRPLDDRTDQFTGAYAAYVAYNPRATQTVGGTSFTGRYVVAVAGTNGTSLFDWLSDTCHPGLGVPWQTFLQYQDCKARTFTSSPEVLTTSTATALGIILRMTAPDSDTTLVSFLKGLSPSVTVNGVTHHQSVTVTGHSLGGVIAPALALALVDPVNGLQGSDPTWTADTVVSYPTAGPAPGNQDFADYYLSILPADAPPDGEPWQVWNTLVCNQYDILPSVWAVGESAVPAPDLGLFPDYFKAAGYSAADIAVLTTAITAAQRIAAPFVAANGPFGHLIAGNKAGLLNGHQTMLTAVSGGHQGIATLNRIMPAVNGPQAIPFGVSTSSKVTNLAGLPTWEEQVLYQHVSAYYALILDKMPACDFAMAS